MSAAIAPAAVESWWDANQRDLVGHLDRVRALLEGVPVKENAAERGRFADERFALGRLAAVLGLTPFERDIVVLCPVSNSKVGSPRSSLTPPAQPRRRLGSHWRRLSPRIGPPSPRTARYGHGGSSDCSGRALFPLPFASTSACCTPSRESTSSMFDSQASRPAASRSTRSHLA